MWKIVEWTFYIYSSLSLPLSVRQEEVGPKMGGGEDRDNCVGYVQSKSSSLSHAECS